MEGENSEADDRDKIKLSQKTSSISLHVFKNDYYIKTKIKSYKRGLAICDATGLVNDQIACKADFNLILPEEIKKYSL